MPKLSEINTGDELPRREHVASNVSLFLDNAAVWNAHRIHYDEIYTKEDGFAEYGTAFLLFCSSVLLISRFIKLQKFKKNLWKLGILAIAFVFMPLFIYHRYKNKNIKDFTFDNYRKDLEKHIKENK